MEPPDTVRDRLASLRIRVSRNGADVASSRLELPKSREELAGPLEELARLLEPGDRVRVEYLDGAADPIPKGRGGPPSTWQVPIDVATVERPTSPLPPPTEAAPLVAPSAAAEPLERPPVAVRPGEEHAAVLSAGMQQLAAAVRTSADVSSRSVALAERALATQETTIRELVGLAKSQATEGARASTSYANAHGRVAEALGNAAGRIGESQAGAIANLAGHVSEAHGVTFGHLEQAHERTREAAVRAAAATSGAPPAPTEPTEPAKPDPAKVLEALSGLVGQIREGVKDASGKAAEEAIAGAIDDLASGKVSAPLAARLKALTPEQKVKIGMTIGTLIGG